LLDCVNMKSQLKQALVIIKSAWLRQLSYRFTIITYRIGEIAETLVLILMWTTIYASGSGTLKGFTLNEMITYVLVGNLVSATVRNFVTSYVSRDILDGRLSMFLVKPIPYIKYILINEIGRVSLATSISVLSQLCVLAFFLDKIIINLDLRYLGLFVVMVSLAFIVELLIGVLAATIAFWTDETDGIEKTIERLRRFFSGGYFPLSLLPASLLTVSMYLPFAYSFFMPAQLYLKKIDLRQGLQGILVQIIWICILSIILHIVWKKGLRRYEATGS
jgi:ABC-2 type transport system permease protein